MPEGPELHLASRYVNTCCKDRIFTGKVEKNPVHKCSDVDFDCAAYTIAAASRGKEMQLILTKFSTDDKKKTSDDKKFTAPETLRILFRFGMSGNFQFTTTDDVHKHSHLRFFTSDTPPMVLSFVDVRRFGRWEVGADWSKDRGPDPMFEYLAFRSNVLSNLKNAAFNQPICEVMLNQKFFNGIGNYLRAEILYRLKIAPFERARGVLEGLPDEPPDVKPLKARGGGGKKGGADPDLIHLCHTVPLEVIAIGAGGYTADGKASDYSDFMKWLQCYYQDGMSNMVDRNGRTIWFHGPAGPMAPKEGKSRSPVKKRKQKGSASGDTPSSVKKEKADKGTNGTKKTTRQRKRAATETDTENAGPVAKKGAPARKKTSTKRSDEKPTGAKKTRQNKAPRIATETQASKSASKNSRKTASMNTSGSASKNARKNGKKSASKNASESGSEYESKSGSKSASKNARKNGKKSASTNASESGSENESKSGSKSASKNARKNGKKIESKNASESGSENECKSGSKSASKNARKNGKKSASESAGITIAENSKVATEGLVNKTNGSTGRGKKKSVALDKKKAQRKENVEGIRSSTRIMVFQEV